MSLGPAPHDPPAAGLALRLLWLRNHLVHDSFSGGVYTYAYDMRIYAI